AGPDIVPAAPVRNSPGVNRRGDAGHHRSATGGAAEAHESPLARHLYVRIFERRAAGTRRRISAQAFQSGGPGEDGAGSAGAETGVTYLASRCAKSHVGNSGSLYALSHELWPTPS